MNPSSAGLWNNPPPPGIDIEEEGEAFYGVPANEAKKHVESLPLKALDSVEKIAPERSTRRRSRSKSVDRHKSKERSPKEQSSKDRTSKERSRDRSSKERSSKDRSNKKRHRSRSRSRGKHRRSRSRSRRRYRSTSRSSRSSSHDRYRRRRRYKRSRSRRHSRSSSRSRSRSRTHRHHRSKRHSRDRGDDRTSESPRPVILESEEIPEVTMEEEEPEPLKENAFKNDGSFLEMFKKMQEEQAAKAQKAEGSSEIKRPLPAFGKRRGGRVLKTGLVEKTKVKQNADGSEPQDAWSVYLKEVKRYKEACCDDDSKTRPLVK